MPKVKYIAGLAKMLDVDLDTFLDVSQTIGIINKNGSPKKKYVDGGQFNPNGTIADYRSVVNLYSEKLTNYLEK